MARTSQISSPKQIARIRIQPAPGSFLFFIDDPRTHAANKPNSKEIRIAQGALYQAFLACFGHENP